MFRRTLGRRQLIRTAFALSAGAVLDACAPGPGDGATAGGGSRPAASDSAAAGGGSAITVAAMLNVVPGLSLPPMAIRKAPPWFTDWIAAFNHSGAAGRATVVAAGPSAPDVNGVDSSVFESWVFGTPPRSPARVLDLSGGARLANRSLPAVLPALAHAFTAYVRSPSAPGAYVPLAGPYAVPLLWHNFCLLANVDLLQGLGLSLPERFVQYEQLQAFLTEVSLGLAKRGSKLAALDPFSTSSPAAFQAVFEGVVDVGSAPAAAILRGGRSGPLVAHVRGPRHVPRTRPSDHAAQRHDPDLVQGPGGGVGRPRLALRHAGHGAPARDPGGGDPPDEPARPGGGVGGQPGRPGNQRMGGGGGRQRGHPVPRGVDPRPGGV